VLDVKLIAVLVVEDDGDAEVLVVALTELEEDGRAAELVEIEVVEGMVDDELEELDFGVDGGAMSK
jgi:inorganic pyrophosphatase